MAEAAGLALGVVALWRTCVEVFDIVASSNTYGLDYEICRVRLEVERVRLLTWGEAVGLSDINDDNPRPDPRLNQAHTKVLVLRVLGCIQRIFENSDYLQDRYGLIQEIASPESAQSEQPGGSLPLIFKRAYGNLKRVGRDRQRAGTIKQKTIWAVHDKTKFQRMVTEIRQFNDSLADLFPDLRVGEALQVQIDESNEIRSLTLLQEASAEDHSALSDSASNRLEALGATATARSILSRDEDGRTVSEAPTEIPRPDTISPPVQNETFNNDIAETDNGSPVVDELENRLREADLFMSKKDEGALRAQLIGPHSWSARVTSSVGWDGRDNDRHWSFTSDKGKGFVRVQHASFGLYHKKNYIQKQRRDCYDDKDDDYVLLDPESSSKFENLNPGTLTVEGFALEAWDYEEQFGKRRENRIIVSAAQPPSIPAKRLLRRLDELSQSIGALGWNPDEDDMNLDDFLFTGTTYLRPEWAKDPVRRISDLYSALNRTDLYTDLTTTSSVLVEARGPKVSGHHGLWNFFWQMILAKELGRRMEQFPDASVTGLTGRVMAALIVADLWFQNCEIILKPIPLLEDEIRKANSPEEEADAEALKERGNEALKSKNYQEALELYQQAVELDRSNPVYRSNKSAALFSLEKYEDAYVDAWIATELDPKYSKAWARLGAACFKLDDFDSSIQAYQIAIHLAGKDVTPTMTKGLADAELGIKEEQKRFENEKDKKKRHAMRGELLDMQWELRNKAPEFHCRVHERQVEGLLLFAEKMKWPYLNETREYAEDVYPNLRGGAIVPHDLVDWIFGLSLPGKWLSFKIMAALVLCSPSITKTLDVSHYYDSGVVLEKQSYWRIRTVLARVLGSLPNVQSLCGWIGPCPPVEFSDQPSESFKPRYIRLKARRIAPTKPMIDDDVIRIGFHDGYEDTRPKPDEDIPAYIAEMTSEDTYVIPEPPIKQLSTVTTQRVKLKRLPLDISARKLSKGLAKEEEVDTEFRASVVFQIDNNEASVTYTLYTNPLFVTLPPCYAGPKGAHEVQLRELKRFQQEPWTVERLKDHTPSEVEEGDVMTINATGKGAEVLARAWCSERGKNAIIRRNTGPCYVCAVKCARMLEIDVLIWAS